MMFENFGDLIQKKIKLASHTSWLIGGEAEYFFEPKDIEKLKEVLSYSSKEEIPVTVLGGGTNVLISDAGIKGLVISLGKYSGIEDIKIDQNLTFWAKAGTNKSELLKIFLKNKLAPAKMLAGLPGQVGGGVVMNAGVGEKLNPREFKEIVSEVEVLKPDGTLKKYNAAELKWDYRHCEGWKPGIVTAVKFSWPMSPEENIITEVKTLNHARLKKQPLEWPSCGSVFRNPLPETAGNLIERSGLKGHTEGGAQISEKHGNFIINRGTASSKDIENLMSLCIKTVEEKFFIKLHSEVVKLA
jgi:UDP-N-acetylmuramate dehydrogenase